MSSLSNRVLKLNIGFLLSDGTHRTHDSTFDFPKLKVADDLTVNYLKGSLRLSRTKEGILVQADLQTAIDDDCYRCLEPINHVIHLDLEELYATDFSNDEAEFFIGDDAVLDLSPLIRAETLIEQSYCKPCRLDANNNCPICKKNFTKEKQDDDDKIDQRLAVLKELLDD